MRFLPLIFLSSVAVGTAGVAAAPSPEAARLRSTLQSMIFPAQAARSADRDQGDDNASLRAITLVCNHDNPSAQRSAICPIPVSPS